MLKDGPLSDNQIAARFTGSPDFFYPFSLHHYARRAPQGELSTQQRAAVPVLALTALVI